MSQSLSSNGNGTAGGASTSSSGPALNLSPSVKSNKTLSLVMTAMHDIAPLALADHSFDNVGLLLEAPKPRKGNGVLLCIDLTTAVLTEAVQDSNISTIICYHPIIFRGLKSLTLSNPQQASLLRCAAEGISIYSPHTSLDATPGGINDWLASGCARFAGFKNDPVPLRPTKPAVEGYEGAGMGRIFTLAEPMTVDKLVQRLKNHLSIETLQVALPAGDDDDDDDDAAAASPSSSSKDLSTKTISTIALCAGSGSSVLSSPLPEGYADADLWLTGELSHHEILSATASGKVVLLTNHSNTERGFLDDRLKPALEEATEGKVKVLVSKADRDPLNVV